MGQTTDLVGAKLGPWWCQGGSEFAPPMGPNGPQVDLLWVPTHSEVVVIWHVGGGKVHCNLFLLFFKQIQGFASLLLLILWGSAQPACAYREGVPGLRRATPAHTLDKWQFDTAEDNVPQTRTALNTNTGPNTNTGFSNKTRTCKGNERWQGLYGEVGIARVIGHSRPRTSAHPRRIHSHLGTWAAAGLAKASTSPARRLRPPPAPHEPRFAMLDLLAEFSDDDNRDGAARSVADDVFLNQFFAADDAQHDASVVVAPGARRLPRRLA